MTCKLMAGDKVLFEQEYYSVGGGFIEWKGYEPPKKGQPKYPYATMKELRQHAEKNNLSIADVIMANEIAVSGKSEEQINAFLDKIAGAMLATVKVGSVHQGRRPARTDQAALEGRDRLGARSGREVRKRPRHRAGGGLRLGRLGGKRPRSPGHHRAHGRLGRGHAGHRLCPGREQAKGAAGEDPRGSAGRRWPSATCASTTRRSPRRRAAASPKSASLPAMAAALIAQAMDSSPQVIENAAESALEHHLGMTCDPVAGYVQVPCIERCAFGAVKAWTAFMIATNEIASRHRVDLDTTIKTLAETGRDMNASTRKRARQDWRRTWSFAEPIGRPSAGRMMKPDGKPAIVAGGCCHGSGHYELRTRSNLQSSLKPRPPMKPPRLLLTPGLDDGKDLSPGVGATRSTSGTSFNTMSIPMKGTRRF